MHVCMYLHTHVSTYRYTHIHKHTHTHTHTYIFSRPAGRFANVFMFIAGITTLSDGGEEIACLFVSVRGFFMAYARNWQNQL